MGGPALESRPAGAGVAARVSYRLAATGKNRRTVTQTNGWSRPGLEFGSFLALQTAVKGLGATGGWRRIQAAPLEPAGRVWRRAARSLQNRVAAVGRCAGSMPARPWRRLLDTLKRRLPWDLEPTESRIGRGPSSHAQRRLAARATGGTGTGSRDLRSDGVGSGLRVFTNLTSCSLRARRTQKCVAVRGRVRNVAARPVNGNPEHSPDLVWAASSTRIGTVRGGPAVWFTRS